MISIVDYGVGNLFSVECSFKRIGEQTVLARTADEIRKSDRILLPGVGAFGDASLKLKESGLDKVILEEVEKGKPLLGICLGMQLLLEKGHEFGVWDGLGLIPGDIVPLKGYVDEELKIPQIGWNSLDILKESPLFKYISNGDCVYFVHSYYAANCEEGIVATTEYSKPVTAVVQRDNVFGCQFHPEKSGDVGLNILRAFCEIN